MHSTPHLETRLIGRRKQKGKFSCKHSYPMLFRNHLHQILGRRGFIHFDFHIIGVGEKDCYGILNNKMQIK